MEIILIKNILVKGILSGLFIYGTLLILYVEFRNRKHTDYPSEVKTISLGLPIRGDNGMRND